MCLSRINLSVLTASVILLATCVNAPSRHLSAQETRQPIDLSLFSDSIHHWQMKDGRGRNDQRFQPEQIIHIAENLLKFQNDDGGWPTNLD